MAEYYASPSGTPGGDGSIGDPWDLQTGLTHGSGVGAGHTLNLRGGTYNGKFASDLLGGTVRSYPGEWAKIDGRVTTTLSGNINDSTSTIPVASTAGMKAGDVLIIDSEDMQIGSVDGGTQLSVTRGWNGTSAASHTSGATCHLGGNHFTIQGDDTTYQDFEVFHSGTERDDDVREATASNIGVYVVNADSNNLINIIAHDNNGGGFFTSASSSNTLLYGCIAYNNGSFKTGTGEGVGHSYYLENGSGYSRIYNCISIAPFNLGMQGFGQTGPYVGGDMRDSVFAISGESKPSGVPTWNLVWGPNSVVSPTANVQDSVFYHRPSAGGYSVQIGFGAGVTDAVVNGNHFLGGGAGGISLQVTSNVADADVQSNIFDSSATGRVYSNAIIDGTWVWNNNTYYNTTTGNSSRFVQEGVGTYTFANWQSTMGYDASGSISSSNLADTVLVKPNSYETGRAHIIIYTRTSPSSIDVDLATTGLVDGQAYTIRNAFDYFGSAVATGTYDEGDTTISLDLTGAATNMVAPLGESALSTTVPEFGIFVVIPGVQAPSTATLSGAVISGGILG